MKLFKKLFTAVLSVLIVPIFVMAKGEPQKSDHKINSIEKNYLLLALLRE